MEQIEVRETIAAVSTAPGVGGIAVIRVSGPKAIDIVNSAWKGIDLKNVKSHSAHLGKYFSVDGNLIDEAVATVFISPASFTGEDIVELSVHGSSWIQRELLSDLVKRGAKIAEPGEFTQRAFLNGKIDLAQAEGVADLIASSSKAAHDLAITQTKGTFSKEFNLLREKLIEFASLLELELDFSEEDVEFADRSALVSLCEEILTKVNKLASSYSQGAVLKNGIPVVIAGIPNAGKSSLLNLLVNDEKAIVTDVPGTTRDIIEDTMEINGILYRFIDTAGLRDTTDLVEGIGVNRAKEALEKAYIVIWVIDPTVDLPSQYKELNKFLQKNPQKHLIVLLNKSDLGETTIVTAQHNSNSNETTFPVSQNFEIIKIPFSTKTKSGLSELLKALQSYATAGQNPESDIIVTNARHYEALLNASLALKRALSSLKESQEIPDSEQDYLGSYQSSDLIAQDIREAITHLSTITGSITTTDLLHSIFSRFCIGK
ncbi:MAG: tRNA uridine-5-carboxymethylaminomethyl(34) synthesis GTPase MnmE [Muribaculaceae bacterium]|nr:tRNA uridine-5-carboxymethylaminomethyl(34) synthesis GTPase MnmE [Muribaculaceae bacterium]